MDTKSKEKHIKSISDIIFTMELIMRDMGILKRLPNFVFLIARKHEIQQSVFYWITDGVPPYR